MATALGSASVHVRHRAHGPRGARGRHPLVDAVRKATLEVRLNRDRPRPDEPRPVLELRAEQERDAPTNRRSASAPPRTRSPGVTRHAPGLGDERPSDWGRGARDGPHHDGQRAKHTGGKRGGTVRGISRRDGRSRPAARRGASEGRGAGGCCCGCYPASGVDTPSLNPSGSLNWNIRAPHG
jgi:hypothetical protein